eukprot:1773091-Amphidinium_carterae.1
MSNTIPSETLTVSGEMINMFNAWGTMGNEGPKIKDVPQVQKTFNMLIILNTLLFKHRLKRGKSSICSLLRAIWDIRVPKSKMYT